MKRVTSAFMVALLGGALTSPVTADPVVEDTNWTLVRSINFNGPYGVHLGPWDSRIYVARQASTDDGLFRYTFSGAGVKLCEADRPAGVLVDPADGDVFFSEIYGGAIFRFGQPAGPKEIWVSGFHTGDDDPAGMAVAPANYTGPMIQPGEALVADRGSTSPDGLWAFSLETPEDEWEVVPNDSALVEASDVAISDTDVYIADAAGYIWILEEGGTVVELTTSEPIASPRGIAVDPLSGDLLVADGGDMRVVRVDPATGEVTNVFTDFGGSFGWAGLDISADGTEIVVSNYTGDAIHVFMMCDPAMFPDEDCNGNGIRDLCDVANGTSEDVNYNNLPDECECVGDLDGDNDVDQGDLGELLAAYNQGDGGDIDNDGDTDQSDLGILLYKYGSVCD